jgi:hypothetical protein
VISALLNSRHVFNAEITEVRRERGESVQIKPLPTNRID